LRDREGKMRKRKKIPTIRNHLKEEERKKKRRENDK
jgi:hypothetical protein